MHLGFFRFFFEADDAPLVVDFHDAKLGCVRHFYRQRGHGYVRAVFLMIVDHLADIHAIDMVGAENRNQLGIVPLDQKQILVTRVGGALVPIGAEAHLRRHRRDKVIAEEVGGAPAAIEMFEQGLRSELGENIKRQDTGVDEIRQDEIDDSIPAAERNRGFGAMFR